MSAPDPAEQPLSNMSSIPDAVMTDADADGGPDAVADGGPDAVADGETEPSQAAPAAATPGNQSHAQEEQQEQIITQMIMGYERYSSHLMGKLKQVNKIIVKLDAQYNDMRARLKGESLAATGPPSIPALVDDYTLPSAHELDKIERLLRLRAFFDILLTCQQVGTALQNALQDARAALTPCHCVNTYRANLARLLKEQRLPVPRQQQETTATAGTGPSSTCSAPQHHPNGSGTIHEFATTADLRAALARDHIACLNAKRDLRAAILAIRYVEEQQQPPPPPPPTTRSTDSASNNTTWWSPTLNCLTTSPPTHPPPRSPSPTRTLTLALTNLQRFDHALRRNETLINTVTRTTTAPPPPQPSAQPSPSPRPPLEARMAAHHRRAVSAAFAEYDDAVAIGMGPDAEHGGLRQKKRELVWACVEWQGWVARREMAGLRGVLRGVWGVCGEH
ncbi:uncharacterized protein BKCO1_490009 [Diplodia corticola]|uniref:Uncharacterized protein n=1 Tax=Diplodia corticola TaxID=236234 RepID=A0A1J9RSE3_9PEZI|nr:uncharacterized protein BKCO1_490009 [Diplodia corticola]OJD31359.1 hypothetical protein BKCO1_490009 [Diplodia corticola]